IHDNLNIRILLVEILNEDGIGSSKPCSRRGLETNLGRRLGASNGGEPERRADCCGRRADEGPPVQRNGGAILMSLCIAVRRPECHWCILLLNLSREWCCHLLLKTVRRPTRAAFSSLSP